MLRLAILLFFFALMYWVINDLRKAWFKCPHCQRILRHSLAKKIKKGTRLEQLYSHVCPDCEQKLVS